MRIIKITLHGTVQDPQCLLNISLHFHLVARPFVTWKLDEHKLALKSSCTPICPVSISCVYPIYPRLPVIQPALGEEADGEKGEGAGGGEGEEDGGGEDAGGGEGSEVSGAVDNREVEDITVADEQPAARARTLRPVAGGAVAWNRSESEAEDGGAQLPVKRHGAKKRVGIEYGETGGAGSSRGQRGLLSQLKSGGLCTFLL